MLKRVGPTVMAIALLSALEMIIGCGGSSFLASENVTATPTFSPGGGVYNASKTVNIASTTSGAVLYCTTDGTPPTTSSPKCAQPTTVYQTEFLQAIAAAPGKSPSAVAAAAYTINLNAAATPTFSPAGGVYTMAQQVAIADATTGANIYYTTDGSLPTTSSTLYAGPITVFQNQTLNAIATASGYANSGVASVSYTINQPVALPVFSVPSGNYTSAQTVAISDATPNAVIYYAINNGMPSPSSTQYTGPIKVSQTESISAIAVLGGSSSAIATAAYTITLPQPPPAPIIYPASGSPIVQGQQVGIVDGDTNASIYYTLDGNTPTASSMQYTASGITLLNLGPVTINAIAIDGGVSSPIATATYTVGASTVPVPRFAPPNGSSITTTQVVTIAETDANASVYYTTDGNNPTASSTPYPPSGITFPTVGAVTVKAVAIDSGTASPIATANYTVRAAGNSFSGTVLSGMKPVSGAQVLLYEAGQSGYGSNATALSVAVTTDSNGAFTMQNYGCSPSPNDLVYLIAMGGDTGNGVNANLEFMAALGSCSKISAGASVVVNEVTTIASAYALAQFMTAAPNVGSSATNYQGLSNAFAIVNNLVDITRGNALSITPAYINSIPYLNSSTVPQARINTLADLLNSCADSNGAGAGCSNLFSITAPPSGVAPANTLQSILNIAQNPGLDLSSIFGASSTGPFQPALSAEPNDWTLALTFTGGGLGIAPNSTVEVSPGNPISLAIINTALAIDGAGNVWITAYADNNPSSLGYGNSQDTFVAGFNSLGAPLTPATSLSADSTPVVTFGGFNPEPGGAIALGAVAIDPSGNLWLGNGSSDGNVIKVGTSPSLSVLVPPQNTGRNIYSAAVDSSGNAWFGEIGNIFEFKSDGTELLSSNGADSSSTATYQELAYLSFDANGGLWGTDFSFPTTLYQINTSDGTIGSNLFPGGAAFTALTLAADGSGNMYICGDPSGMLDVFNAGGETANYSIPTGRGCGEQLLLDGQGHLFAVSDGLSFPGGSGIDEFTINNGDLQLISPAASGYTGTSSEEPPTILIDPNALFFYLYPVSAAIDGSGNLWVLNADTNGSTGPGNVLVEFVGIAAPVVTPISMGQPGVRP